MATDRLQRVPRQRPIAAPVSPYRLPTGKGMFVRALSHAGTPQQMVARAKWAGLRWVAVLVIWQSDDDQTYNEDLPAYAAALRAAGIQIWVWGFPELLLARRIAFAKALGSAAVASKAMGCILDAEKPWIGATHDQVVDLVGRVRSAAPGRIVGLTSYGLTTNFPSFPFESFAATCDLALPQAYSDALGDDYQADSVTAYQDMGFPAVVPALAAYELSVAQMLEIYARTPQPDAAVIWWDWYNADQHGTWPAIRAAGLAPVGVI